MFPDELSDTGLYITQRPKQVNLSTEVVKGVVPQVGIEVVHGTRGTKGSTEMVVPQAPPQTGARALPPPLGGGGGGGEINHV